MGDFGQRLDHFHRSHRVGGRQRSVLRPSLSAATPPATTATFNGSDTKTQGSWIGTYGSQGYNIINSGLVNPTYATITPAGQSPYTWAASTTALPALQDAPGNGTSRIAAAWYSTTSFTIDVNVTDGNSHELELYLLDYVNAGRVETVTLSDAKTHAVLDTENISSFQNGIYLKWAISGNVLITFTAHTGSAVVSGLFFDPVSAPPPPPATTATFNGSDTKTQGSWIGTYGSQGYNIINSGLVNPTYATITPAGQSPYTWAASTTALPALQDAPGNGTSRIAAAWYSTTSFTIDVNVTDGNSHELELYLLDYVNAGRVETVTLSDAKTHAVLDTENISSFQNGIYLKWAISGNVLITFTPHTGSAVVSGLFFDPTISSSAIAAATAVSAVHDAAIHALGTTSAGSADHEEPPALDLAGVSGQNSAFVGANPFVPDPVAFGTKPKKPTKEWVRNNFPI